jgi:predicted Zn-dependent peptidase
MQKPGDDGHYICSRLSNGIQVCTELLPWVESISLGIWVATGAEHETTDTYGLTHFLEHMLFKGTDRRTARDIAEAMDGVGGQLNAFTDRESTCFYARVLSDHLPLAVDLLSDMLLRSRFDPVELDREKQVVVEEIKRYQDSPEEWVHDLFARSVWRDHPLGNSPLGEEAVIGSLTPDKAREFLRQHYVPANITIAAAGNFDHHLLVSLLEPELGKMEQMPPPGPEAGPVPPPRPDRVTVSRPTEQVHFCMGAGGFAQTDDRRFAMAALDCALGGGMSSRLFQEVRENRGLAYNIGSYSPTYRQSGLFYVSAGTSPKHFAEVVDLVHQEFDRVREQGLTEAELARAKEQMKGALALALESTSYRMRRIATSQMYWKRIIPFDEVLSKVNQITPEDVSAAAALLLDRSTLSLVAIGPV